MGSVAVMSAWMATLACFSTSGLCFLVGLKDAGAKTGTLGGMAKSIAIGATFSAVVWCWALFVVYTSTT